MAKAYKCDRCGRYADGFVKHMAWITPSGDFCSRDADKFELCKSCYESIKVELEGVHTCYGCRHADDCGSEACDTCRRMYRNDNYEPKEG